MSSSYYAIFEVKSTFLDLIETRVEAVITKMRLFEKTIPAVVLQSLKIDNSIENGEN